MSLGLNDANGCRLPDAASVDSLERQPADPTPAEIRQRAASIRKRWSKRVTDRRRLGPDGSWRPPLVRTSEVLQAIINH